MNRQKMELRAWNVRDMPRQSDEVFEKQLAKEPTPRRKEKPDETTLEKQDSSLGVSETH